LEWIGKNNRGDWQVKGIPAAMKNEGGEEEKEEGVRCWYFYRSIIVLSQAGERGAVASNMSGGM
jgi:hypothetical protein